MKDDSSPEKPVVIIGFQLRPDHLARLHEIQRQRRELDPGMKTPAIGKCTR